MTEQQNDTLFEFPCQFPIKAMGETSSEFNAIVTTIVRRHAGDINDSAISTKQSSGGKYTSVTVTIQATSKAQIDAIYQELTHHVLVKYVL